MIWIIWIKLYYVVGIVSESLSRSVVTLISTETVGSIYSYKIFLGNNNIVTGDLRSYWRIPIGSVGRGQVRLAGLCCPSGDANNISVG